MARRPDRSRGFVLTDRDEQTLLFLGTVRYASARQLVLAGLYPSQDRALRRARRLFDEGLVRRHMQSSRSPLLLSLNRAGKRALERAGHDVDRLSPAGAINPIGVAHHLLTIDARLYVLGAAQMEGAHLTSWSGPQGYDVTRIGLPRAFRLRPDGLAIIHTPGVGEWRVCAEADTGTEGHRILADKLEKYAAAFEQSVVDEVWFVVDAGPRRVSRISEIAVRAGLGERARVMTAEHVRARPCRRPLACVGAALGATDTEFSRTENANAK